MIDRNKPCVEIDLAGPGGHVRHTEWPSGRTIVRQPFMSDERWEQELADWYKAAEPMANTPATRAGISDKK